jgi:3-phenylpropionate/cinnamic acid dioxygenase small subunit
MRTIVALLAMLMTAGSTVAAGPGLVSQIQVLEDERDIREVLVLYGEYLDAKEYANYASLFAQDGMLTVAWGTATGPAAIEKLLIENAGKPPPGYVNKDRFHLMTTAVIRVDGDRATARSRYTVFEASPDNRPSAVHSGRYEDELVREADGWKIRRRITHGVLPYREPPKPS